MTKSPDSPAPHDIEWDWTSPDFDFEPIEYNWTSPDFDFEPIEWDWRIHTWHTETESIEPPTGKHQIRQTSK